MSKKEAVSFDYFDKGSTRVYTVTDDLLNSQRKYFENELMNCARNYELDIILDFQSIFKIDSMSLAMIIRISRDCFTYDKSVTVININDAVKTIFEISGMDELLG
jgi:anti-anti-sigma factor